MPIPTNQSLSIIFIISLVTFALRFLPFLLFPGNKKTPEYITYLGKVLPYSIMGMLIVFCLKGVSTSGSYGIPEAISILFIVIIHVWKRNTLLSIASGTILYMFFVQVVMPFLF